ncbi:MAG TPA: hypothetical protein VFJ57_13320 [Solirubrobacterales bacterium]|nr:hypothetical protein [Solirubrobacterales bacterium]
MPDFFPSEAGVEYESSELTMGVFRDEEYVEELELNALLKLERGAPQTTLTGHRHFEFAISEWEVQGRSEALDGVISLSLANVPQPHSLCLAAQPDGDFPSVISYNAIFDVYFNNARVLESQTGLGIGTGIMQIPPRGIDIAFQKAFELGDWSFRAGACKKMASMTEREFTAQADEFRALRED